MPDAYTDLRALVRASTVRLLPGDPLRTDMWGSGFFIAPGWVLTCAHVLLPHIQNQQEIFRVAGDDQYDGVRPTEARLEWPLIAGLGTEGLPAWRDLALVRLLDDSVEHECVWVSDRSDESFGDSRAAWGFRPAQEEPDRYELWYGDLTNNVRDGRCVTRFEPTAEFPPGISGGPVFDPASGAVVGVVKSGREGRDGGRAVDAAALRALGPLYNTVISAHDRWHAGRLDTAGSWSALREREQATAGPVGSGGDDWSTRDRVKALRLLTEVPPPGSGEVVEALARYVMRAKLPHAQPALVSWRDGLGLLQQAGRPLPAVVFLHFLRLVAGVVKEGGGDPKALDTWINKRLRRVSPHYHLLVEGAVPPQAVLDRAAPAPPAAHRAFLPYPGPDDGVQIVVVELEELPYGTIHWQIRIDDGSGDTEVFEAEGNPDGIRLAELRHRLRGPLDEAFQMADAANGAPAPCEIVLPAGYFDIPVHRWQLGEDAPLGDAAHLPLGARRRVVLRDLARRGIADKAWAERWSALAEADRLAAVRTPPFQERPRTRHFTEMGADSVPVLCHAAGTGIGRKALDMAASAGHGIALWHIEGHRRQGPCGDICEAVNRGAAELLGATAASELPDRLRHIREEIHERREQGHWAEALAVLYDDPRRPVPAGPLGPVNSP